ncbi:MAG: hypothetical protein QXG76_01235 [Candidatus Bathyarchaeia archaeon]
MPIKWILFAISIILFVGPIGGALLLHSDNLLALIIPENFSYFIEGTPEIEYLNYSITDGKIALQFNFKNPYDVHLEINSIDGDIYCTEHNFRLGTAREKSAVSISPKSISKITLILNFNNEALSHFINNHPGETNVSIELRDIRLTMQGVEIHYKQSIAVEAIPIPATIP